MDDSQKRLFISPLVYMMLEPSEAYEHIECPRCNGACIIEFNGYDYDDPYVDCPLCDGAGMVYKRLDQ